MTGGVRASVAEGRTGDARGEWLAWADMRARPVSRGRACGMRAGQSEGGTGHAGRARGELGRLLVLGWIPVFGFWVSFFFPFLFLVFFQTSLKLLNSNMNLNSTLALKQIKQCTSMNAQSSLP